MALQLIVGQGVTHNRIFLRKCPRWSYCDPPYLHSTRRDHCLYGYEMTDHRHEALLGVLLRLPCGVHLRLLVRANVDTLRTWRVFLSGAD